MAEGVKPRRRYESPRRRQQAAETRRDILVAAQRLFERQGYAATSMAAIATDAGVALKTVYLAFETKRGLLLALWHLLLRGDEEPVPIGERSWYRDVIEESDPRKALTLLAHHSTIIKERAGPVLAIIRDAAAADPEIDLWRRIETDFYDHQRKVVESLEQKGALLPGLDANTGADILWTINHPSTYWLLVKQRGWTPERYEVWLAETAVAQLVRPPARRRRDAATA